MKKDYAPESGEESLGVSRESHDYYAAHARQWRNRVGLCVLVVVLLFWAYTLFVTPFFTIQSVTILGLNKIQQEEMQDRIAEFLEKKQWGVLQQGNIFLLRINNLVSYFKNDVRIATMRVQKNYEERSLVVTVEERVPIYIVSLPDRAFAIDKEGMALIPLSVPVPQGTLPIILDKRERSATLGTKVIADTEIIFFNTLNNELARIAPFTSIIIGEPSPEAVTFSVQEGWALYLNLTDDPKAQFERLRVLLTLKIKPEKRKKLQYIDLRFGERVYYK
ncbi:MAG: hypothetical protein Q7S16_03535 [bacterium]|nr:hypothetical protein [bacterium]